MGEGADGLAATLEELDELNPWCRYIAGDPDGPGWIGIDEVRADPGVVAGWIDQLLAGPAQGRTDVAGSYLAGWLGGLLVAPAASTAIARRRAWTLAPGSLAVHRHPDGWFDGLAVRRATLVVLPDGAEPDRLYDHLAADAVELLTPIFKQIRAVASFGTAGMWGSVADAMADAALERARRTGDDPDRVWTEAQALLDRIAARVPTLRLRPTLARVVWSGGVTPMAVRGTCCLYYKVAGCEPGPTGDAYCVSCPKRDHDDRLRRWSLGLEELAQVGAGGAS